MNGHSAPKDDKEKPRTESILESGPDLLVSTESSESNELSKSTSQSQKSTNYGPEDDTNADSTSSDATQSTTRQKSQVSPVN